MERRNKFEVKIYKEGSKMAANRRAGYKKVCERESERSVCGRAGSVCE